MYELYHKLKNSKGTFGVFNMASYTVRIHTPHHTPWYNVKVELSKDEIKKRLIKLSNLEYLYVRAKERIGFLEKENKELKQRIKELEDKNRDLNGKIEALSFQFEQIKNKLFGKKPIVNRIAPKKEKRERDIFSYHRPIPKNITKI